MLSHVLLKKTNIATFKFVSGFNFEPESPLNLNFYFFTWASGRIKLDYDLLEVFFLLLDVVNLKTK